MKKIKIVIVLLSIGIVCQTQISYNLDSILVSTFTYNDSLTITHDTQKVLLLMCDTSKPYDIRRRFTFDTLINESWIIDTIYYERDHNVYWQFGYEVLVNSINYVIDPYYNGCVYGDFWRHLKYLDENKQEFPDNIIIWKSIKID